MTRESLDYDGELLFAVGKDIGGGNVLYDLIRTPHLLLGCATGTGNSVYWIFETNSNHIIAQYSENST